MAARKPAANMWETPDMGARAIEVVPVAAADGKRYEVSVYTLTMAELLEFEAWREQRLRELGAMSGEPGAGQAWIEFDLEVARRSFAGVACEGRLYGDIETMPSHVFRLAAAVALDFREAGGLRRAATAGGSNGARSGDLAALGTLAASGEAVPPN